MSSGDDNYWGTYRTADGDERLRRSVARDAFRMYLGSRDTAKAGVDPIMWTSWDALAKSGTVALLAVRQADLGKVARDAVVNRGAVSRRSRRPGTGAGAQNRVA